MDRKIESRAVLGSTFAGSQAHHLAGTGPEPTLPRPPRSGVLETIEERPCVCCGVPKNKIAQLLCTVEGWKFNLSGIPQPGVSAASGAVWSGDCHHAICSDFETLRHLRFSNEQPPKHHAPSNAFPASSSFFWRAPRSSANGSRSASAHQWLRMQAKLASSKPLCAYLWGNHSAAAAAAVCDTGALRTTVHGLLRPCHTGAGPRKLCSHAATVCGSIPAAQPRRSSSSQLRDLHPQHRIHHPRPLKCTAWLACFVQRGLFGSTDPQSVRYTKRQLTGSTISCKHT